MKKIIGNSGAKKQAAETSKQKAARILQQNKLGGGETPSPSIASTTPSVDDDTECKTQ